MQLAKDCCQPEPSDRPDFPTVAEAFATMLKAFGEDKDPRPVARIKNKKVSRISISAPDGGASPDKPAGDASKAPAFMHSTYRSKFRNKGAGGGESPRAGADAGAGSSADGAADGDEKSPLASARDFMDTFSSTLLNTFTPGKEASPPKAGERV